ncbi:hypothetical protein EV359DRAFT_85022 [Lentinula novae-zelandiae]|nr:hypothetical protein EV359DRAFT_85022 [Lentinula novae-zelandiae]
MTSQSALFSVSSNSLCTADSQSVTQSSSARVVARRKAKLNVYFREECEDRSVSDEDQKVLAAHFASFIEDYIVKTTPEYEATGAGFRLQDVFDADHKAWEIFRAQNFPCESTSLIKITFESIIKPAPKNTKPSAPLTPLLNKTVKDIHHTSHASSVSNAQGLSQQMMTMFDGNVKSSPPTRKVGWKKEKPSLLKGVLVSNANKISTTYEVQPTESRSSNTNSSAGNLLQKETILEPVASDVDTLETGAQRCQSDSAYRFSAADWFESNNQRFSLAFERRSRSYALETRWSDASPPARFIRP